jgi:gliding motility-associated-like protein
MKRLLIILTLFFSSKTLLAEHITGGEIYYVFQGVSNGNYNYKITLKLFRHCENIGAALDDFAAIGIFSKPGNTLFMSQSVPRVRIEQLQLTTPGPCITNAPSVCYQAGYYEWEVSLPGSASGYTIAYQRCCRINGINNLIGSSNTGATYIADIPGTSLVATGPMNNSAQFNAKDTVIVCGGYPFTYSFGAVDADPTDELRYSFCEAYIGGSSGSAGSSAPNPPANPPYSPVSYNPPYGASNPLGPTATIDPLTGLISGNSPPAGIYVVTVCVQEIRNGVVIATQRKDVQIKAGGCAIAEADLQPKYVTCDGLSFSFTHPNNPLINTFYWEFGDPASGVNNTSNLQNPTHDFSAPGDYTVKLVTNRNQECSDSTTAIVGVWPGFFPEFSSTGVCITNPVVFQDESVTNYGVVDSWSWDFGDAGSTSDVSSVSDPQWSYTSTGTKDVRLIVTNSKGCVDTIIKPILVIDKPIITLAFKDTLICVPDAVQLQASGTGVFSWTPNVNIVNANTATPTVNPTTTTTYTVQLNEQGCINTDNVQVRVVNFVTLNEMNDTLICQTDQVQLNVTSDGLQYQWTPAAAVNDATIQDPIGISGNTQTYTVTAIIGSCTATRDIVVTAAPYPVVNAGPDTTICYNTPAFLNGSHNGDLFAWTPVSTLLNANTLSPTAYPAKEGLNEYVLTSHHTGANECPKSGRDTVGVTVLPKIRPFAGNDTLVIVGQPLQFNATGGESYVWTPPTGLSNPNLHNPIGIYGPEIDSITYTVQVFNTAGCFDTATVKVTVFKTNPYVFVPTGFTPNGDGLNDEIRPIAVGVKKINYFRVFNRWGQMVFHTTTNGYGWDGKIGGVPQGTNVYVWMVSAVDYLDKPIFLKGTTTLIR